MSYVLFSQSYALAFASEVHIKQSASSLAAHTLCLSFYVTAASDESVMTLITKHASQQPMLTLTLT